MLNSSTFSKSTCDFWNKNNESHGSSWNGIIVFNTHAIILRDTIENSISQPEQTYINRLQNVMEHFVTDFQKGLIKLGIYYGKILQDMTQYKHNISNNM